MQQHLATDVGPSDEQAVEVTFSYVAADDNEFVQTDGLAYRSLGGVTETGGAIVTSEVRPVSGPVSVDDTIDSSFRTIYVLAGSVSLAPRDGAVTVLAKGDVATLRHGYAFTMDVTADAWFLDLRSGAFGPDRSHGALAEEPLINREEPQSYRLGASPTAQRPFLHYREIPVPASAADAVRLEIIRADTGGHSSGWHYHPMAQVVFAVEGSAVVDVAAHGSKALAPVSAIYISANLPHNLREISADYRLLEAFIPGIGGTTQCEAPC